MSTPRKHRKTKKTARKNKHSKPADALPHLPNSDGADFRRREIHRVLAEEFDHPNKEHRPGWSAKRLAELVGYEILTVKRTIEYMRKTQMLPIGYDKKRDTYFYKERVAAFPTTQVSEGELICLCGMMCAIAPFRNTPFVEKLRPLIDKFIEAMSPELRVSFRTLEKRISFRSIGLDAHLDPTIFETVIAALLKNQEPAIDYLKMHYEEEEEGAAEAESLKPECGARVPTRHSPGSQQRPARGDRSGGGEKGKSETGESLTPTPNLERRTIEPLHLACVDNGWYLFAYDPSREKIRRFLLTRMKAARVTGRSFKPRAFDIDEVMAPSFGIFDGNGVPVNLSIRFRDKGVRLIQERSWHHSEKLELMSDGTAVLSMQVTHTPQVEGWILHWGRLAHVLEPATVREGVENQARDILAPWPA